MKIATTKANQEMAPAKHTGLIRAFKVIARVKRFVHQRRLGTNKILSNRVKLTSARALETKSVLVFLCSIYRLSNETVVCTSVCYL